MSTLLLSAHVLAAIIFVGPVTVAVSLFPRCARQALAGSATSAHDHARRSGPGSRPGAVVRDIAPSAAVVRLLHRISRVYAVLGLSVPVLGVALATQLRVLTDAWLLTSIALTAAAALILATIVLPAQQHVMDDIDGRLDPAAVTMPRSVETSRLAMASGTFALLWAVVVVLMVARPGSTTGV